MRATFGKQVAARPCGSLNAPEPSHVLLQGLYLVTKCKHQPVPPYPPPRPHGRRLWSGRVPAATIGGDSRTLQTAEGRWFLGAQPRASSSGHVPVPVLDSFLLKLAQVGVAFCTRPRTPQTLRLPTVGPVLGLLRGVGHLRGGRAPGLASLFC